MKNLLFTGKDKTLIKRAILYVKPYKLAFVILITCVLGIICLELMQPIIVGKITGSFIDKSYSILLQCILLLCVLKLFEMFVEFVKSYVYSWLNSHIAFDINCQVYKKILKLPLKAFDEMRAGEFMTRLTGDTGAISNIITNQLLNVIVNIIKALVIGVLVFRISSLLATITLLIFPFSYFIFFFFGKTLRKKSKEIKKINDKYFSNIQQSLLAVREVKTLGIGEDIYTRFEDLAEILRDKSININIVSTFSKTAVKFITVVIGTSIIGVSGLMVYRNMLRIGDFVTFMMYGNQFIECLKSISELNSTLQQLLVSLERVFEIVDNVLYKDEEFGSKHLENPRGDISFNDVYFEYNSDKPIFKGLSLDIKHNSRIAIVGRSGAGKSTIFNLLMRLYKPYKGTISIDGIDLNKLDEETLKRSIAIVRQEPFLFNMSIKDNLLLANNSASDNEIIEACKSAYIHEYIIKLPRQYDSVIGENGVNLSGGQKQRLAIARALLKKSRIILFDEATSSLDNESQHYIKEVIGKMSSDRTVLIIAHRLSTIFDADEILVIDEGRLIDRGSHNALFARNDIYRLLYETEILLSEKTESEVS